MAFFKPFNFLYMYQMNLKLLFQQDKENKPCASRFYLNEFPLFFIILNDQAVVSVRIVYYESNNSSKPSTRVLIRESARQYKPSPFGQSKIIAQLFVSVCIRHTIFRYVFACYFSRNLLCWGYVNLASTEICAFEYYFTRRCTYFQPRFTRNIFNELICTVKHQYGQIGGNSFKFQI